MKPENVLREVKKLLERNIGDMQKYSAAGMGINPIFIEGYINALEEVQARLLRCESSEEELFW